MYFSKANCTSLLLYTASERLENVFVKMGVCFTWVLFPYILLNISNFDWAEEYHPLWLRHIKGLVISEFHCMYQMLKESFVLFIFFAGTERAK